VNDFLRVEPHPLLSLAAWKTRFSAPLADSASPAWLSALLRSDAETALEPPSAELRARVRDLLRHGGYKPTGRGKPASEYLLRAASEGALSTINPAVDIGNVISLHSGFPISVVDLAKARPPLSVALAAPGAAYVFNASGQSIELGGLLCLGDAEGPCANAVKDAQRTKTSASTCETLTIVWGVRGEAPRLESCVSYAQSLTERLGATFERLQ
jgi:DNA/RNA-binding domain of Phe-tRNA-synthetase-like protein